MDEHHVLTHCFKMLGTEGQYKLVFSLFLFFIFTNYTGLEEMMHCRPTIFG